MDRIIAALNAASAIVPTLLPVVAAFAPGVARSQDTIDQALAGINSAATVIPALAGIVPFARQALAGQQLNDADIAALAAAADLVDAACEAQVARITGAGTEV